MTNRPLAYTLSERTATVGALAGKTVIQANSTGRKRIDHRTFCEEVAKKHVENGDIVDFGDIGSLRPSFQSKLVEKGKEEFNAAVHITKPVVKLMPSRRYFTLTGVTYERVEAPAKKP